MRIRALCTIALITLAGCGGGGGAAPGAPVTAGPSSAASLASVAGASTEATFANVSKAEADQAISGRNAGLFTSLGARPQSFGNIPYGQCVPDGTYAGMILAAPVKTGSTTAYEITYYRDPACASKARNIKNNVVDNGNSSYTATRVLTNFDASGNQLAQRNSTVTIKGGKDNLSAQSTASLSYQGNAVGSAMDEWSIAPGSSANVFTVSGDGARVTATAQNAYGASHALSAATKTVNADGTATYAWATANTLYKGAAGALSITPAVFPGPFTIAPSSDALGSGNLTWNATYDANGLPTNLQVSGTLAQDATLSVTTSTGAPIVFSGTVTGPSGSVLATFTVDQFGNGSLSFADGSTREIYDWHAFKG